MTTEIYSFCVFEIENYTDRDAYIADVAMSAIWQDAEDTEIPVERLEGLGLLWDACHRDIKEIATAAGMSQRKLAERFLIPYRTVEDWSAGRNECRLYILLMIQALLGLLGDFWTIE